MNGEELIAVGRVVAPHGVRGDLRILPDTDRPEIFKVLRALRIGNETYRLTSGRPHKNVYILHVEGVDDRNAAELLVGEQVTVPFSALPPRKQGEYYYFQLIGLSVVDESGRAVGTLTDVLETGANNVYVIAGNDGKELLLPAIPSCILSIEIDKGIMTVALPEWE